MAKNSERDEKAGVTDLQVPTLERLMRVVADDPDVRNKLLEDPVTVARKLIPSITELELEILRAAPRSVLEQLLSPKVAILPIVPRPSPDYPPPPGGIQPDHPQPMPTPLPPRPPSRPERMVFTGVRPDRPIPEPWRDRSRPPMPPVPPSPPIRVPPPVSSIRVTPGAEATSMAAPALPLELELMTREQVLAELGELGTEAAQLPTFASATTATLGVDDHLRSQLRRGVELALAPADSRDRITFARRRLEKARAPFLAGGDETLPVIARLLSLAKHAELLLVRLLAGQR